MDIFKLVGSIFVDSEQADRSLAKTDEKAGNVAQTLYKGIETAGKWGAAIAGGTAAAASAIVGLANNSASTADTIDKASIRMGVGAEYYQKLAYAAGQSGVEMSAMEKAAKKLEGTGLNMEDALNQIMELGTAEERATMAAELFGESVAYTLSPLIEQSGESFNDLIERADELGIVMSEDNVAAGVKLGDTLSDVKQSFGALVTEIGSSVVPIVQQFADMILENLPMIQGLIDQIIPVISNLANAALPPIMQLVQSLLPMIIALVQQLLPFITQIIETALPIFIQLINTLIPPLMDIITAIMPALISLLEAVSPILNLLFTLLTPILDVLIAIIVPLVQLLTELIQPIIDKLTELMQSVLEPFIPVIESVGKLLTDVLAAAFEALSPVIDMIQGVFEGFIDFIKNVFSGNWEGAWNSIVGIFETIWNGIIDIVKNPINAVLGFINGMVKGIVDGVNVMINAMNKLSFTVPDWVPGIGGNSFGFNLETLTAPQIPLLAEGGDVIEKGKAIVGEAGAELIDLPVGARVTPLTQGAGELVGTDQIVEAIKELYDRLNELAEMLINAIASMTVVATMDPDEAFDTMKKKNQEYKEMTGKYAF